MITVGLALPVLLGAGVSAPDVNSSDEAPQNEDVTSNDPNAVPSSGTGAISGLVTRDCGGSALAGCQGQGIPDLELGLRSVDSTYVASVRTAADGSFWASLPPGSYLVENESRPVSDPIEVHAGQVTYRDVAIGP